MPSATVRSPSGDTWRVKVVTTPLDIQQGLMFQKTLKSHHGMFFKFEDAARRSMWMKNMLISLDIVWLNESLQIVHVNRNAIPCTSIPCKSYSSVYKAHYAIEMNAGEAQNLSPGMVLRFI